ncbi:MAG: hypothetical protein OEW48_11100 [Phycisphaerae bacterium]|nr:hypothetical protein [Phycisphaerae bacterium]
MKKDLEKAVEWKHLTPLVLLALSFVLLKGCTSRVIQKEMKTMSDLEWGPVTAWCQISASADRPSYKASENIYVTVVLKNASGQTVQYQPFPFSPEIDYKVTFEDGAPVELTAFGRIRRDSAGITSSAVEKIMSGKEIVYEILLNRRYDMTLAGNYKFQVFRQIEVDSQGKLSTATSNIVDIEVVEQE